MANWLKYTTKMEKKLTAYQQKNLITKEDMMVKAKLSESTFYKFKTRGKISKGSIKKIKELLGVDLLK